MSRKDVSNISLPRKQELDTKSQLHENFAAGFPPFLRGNSVTMFIENPLKTIQITDTLNISEQFSQKGLILIYSETTLEIEIADNFLKGLELIKSNVENGITIDSIAQKIFFAWNSEQNHFKGIAKIRAARMLWAKLVKKFNPREEKSMSLQSVHLTKQMTDITIEAVNLASAIFSGIETIAYPMIDTLAQAYIQEETEITKTIDPWAGSVKFEKMTKKTAINAWKLIRDNFK